MHKALHEDNRRAWNEITPIHNSHKAEQAKFLREDGSTLFPEEIALLGDIHGDTLLHLQCNNGQDTLSLAKLGADVTGVDISDEAIDFARRLSAESGNPARFERADIYDWLSSAAARGERFDRVFSSYGVIPWLSDIRTWGKGIASVLKPGGRCVLVDFHPIVDVLDYEDITRIASPCFGSGRVTTYHHGMWDYVADSGEALAPSGLMEGVTEFKSTLPVHEFAWTVSEVIMALLDAGLRLAAFEEYPYSNGCKFFPDMRLADGARWYPPEEAPNLPLMFGLAAEKEHE